MGRFIIIVLDGFGIGEMPDAKDIRPQDKGANTCLHIFEQTKGLYLPTLERLGLSNILARPLGGMEPNPSAIFGKGMLMHDGADTFFGHQEIMGTRPRKPFGEPFRNKIQEVKEILQRNGFAVREYAVQGEKILIVEENVTVADNIECDPGQAFNVTAAIDHIRFSQVLKIGNLVRSVSKVPRVITFGGRKIQLQNLLDSIQVQGKYIGVNAPLSGVYNHDYHCVHMGYGVEPGTQVPTILGKAGIPVFLIGKVADVVSNEYGRSIPMVDTTKVLEETGQLIENHNTGFFCANVQETDLCGHRQNTSAYAEKLKEADQGIKRILPKLAPEDVMVVMADHGNDPIIGHAHHTREMVPLMIYSPMSQPANIGIRTTLSDVGATVADYFNVKAPENGKSMLHLLKSN